MEARIVTVVNANTQSKTSFETAAETLGQLKADMDAKNISYEGMLFYEGLSKTEILGDDSALPKDVPFKGGISNNLVFLLTAPKEKIKNGMGYTRRDAYTRKEAYEYINKLKLQDVVKDKYGKSYTNVPTKDLEELIDEYMMDRENINTENMEESVYINTMQSIKEDLEQIYKAINIAIENIDSNIEYIKEEKNSYESEIDDIIEDLRKCIEQ